MSGWTLVQAGGQLLRRLAKTQWDDDVQTLLVAPQDRLLTQEPRNLKEIIVVTGSPWIAMLWRRPDKRDRTPLVAWTPRMRPSTLPSKRRTALR